MSNPQFVAAGTGSETSCAWPTHQVGDRAVLVVEHGAGTVATPTGCAIVPGFPMVQSAGSTLSAFSIVATTTSQAALALSGGTDHMWGVIFLFRHVHPTDPFLAIAVMPQQGAVTAAVTPATNAKVKESMALMIVAWIIDDAGPIAASWANASLASVSEQYDAGTTTGNGGGITAATGTLSSVGPISRGSVTLTSSAYTAAMIVLRPSGNGDEPDITGTVEIDSVAAADGGTVEIWDTTHDVLAGTTTIAGGAGGFTFNPAHMSGVSYVAVYDDGTERGCSEVGDPTTDTFDISIFTGGGGGGLAAPAIGPHFIR